MKRISTLAVFAVGLVLLSACVGSIPSMPSDTVPGAGEQQAPPAASATPTPTPEVGAVSPAQTESMQDDGEPQSPPAPSATPTVRPELEATDPESVGLASGKPTLLEFFAFW